MHARTTSFSELVAAAQVGDDRASDELHRRYVPQVMRRLRSRARHGLRRSHDTVDLAQSVFVEVLRDLPRFEDRGEEAFKNWLLIKAENKVRAKFRKQYRQDEHLGAVVAARGLNAQPGPGPVTNAGFREREERVQAVLALLSDEHRQILVLRQERGMKYGDIAAMMGLASADAARMRHARAIMAFRRKWKIS